MKATVKEYNGFGGALRKARKEKGIILRTVGKVIGISVSAIVSIEQGRLVPGTDPVPDYVLHWIKFLDLDEIDLIE